MHIRKLTSVLVAGLVVAGLAAIPSVADAQGNGKHKGWDHSNHWGARKNDRREDDHRDRDDWRRRAEVERRAREAQERALRYRNEQLRRQVRYEDHRADAARLRALEAQRRAQYFRDRNRATSYTTRPYYPGTTYRSVPQYSYQHRSDKMNEWRNIAMVSGGIALLGLLQHDNRLVFPGAAGALYSLYRYDQDRKSRNGIDRARAAYFSRPYFVRDGRRYDREVVSQNGSRYYRFVRR